MKDVKVYQPDLQVLLHKTVGRKPKGQRFATSERFRGSTDNRVIDLAPWIGEAGSLSVSKGVSEPAGGFTLVLADRQFENAGTFDSIYGIIEPMDMVEIRMRHGAPDKAGVVPIVMRGFISDIRRSEAMGGDGRPVRTVTLSGQDFGKIWQIIQINYFVGYLLGQAFITDFKLFEQFGTLYKTTMSPAEFVGDVVDKVLNAYIADMLPGSATMPRAIKKDITVSGGTVSPGIQAQQGSIYELLRTFGDVGPWNELFIEDREDGVYCVYRPNPFKDLSTDQWIQAETKGSPPVYVDIDAVDIMAISVSRSDANVGNFYWVDSARFYLISGAYSIQATTSANDPTVVLKDYPNSDSRLYGIRLMRVATQQGGDDMDTHNSGGKADAVAKLEKSAVGWMDGRRRVLVESNRDNVVMERGSIRMRGNQDVRAGRYLRVRRGGVESTYYVTQVDHEFVPFTGFFTTATVERGDGFVRRIARGGSPYLDELKD